MITLKTLFSIIAQKKRYGKSKVFVLKKNFVHIVYGKEKKSVL